MPTMARRRWLVFCLGVLAGIAYFSLLPLRQNLRMRAIQQSLSERDLTTAQIQLEDELFRPPPPPEKKP